MHAEERYLLITLCSSEQVEISSSRPFFFLCAFATSRLNVKQECGFWTETAKRPQLDARATPVGQ